MGKYTYSQVKEKFEERGDKLISTEYKYVSEKLLYICPKHEDKGIQKISFSKLCSNRGCYFCGRKRNEAARTVPINEEEDKKLCEKNNFTYISSEKIDHVFYIRFICNNHRDLGEQTMTKANMKRDIKGCQYCSSKNLPEWYVMEKKEEINPTIKILEPYVNLTTPIKYICTKHNYSAKNTMQSILRGQGCYYCGIEKLSQQSFLSDETVIKNVKRKNPHVDLVQYNGESTASIWHCNRHNKNFKKNYLTLLTCESGCDECYREFIRERSGLGLEEFKNRLSKVHPELIVKGEYINSGTNIELFCTKHNHTYSTTPVSAIKRLSCCPKSRVTYKEEYMCSLLEKWNYNITRQKIFEDCRDKNCLPFDCYLDDYNVCIEYDGEQHFRPVRFGKQKFQDTLDKFEITKKHDAIKNDYCKKNNIPLIRVPYYYFDDLEYFLFDKLSILNVIIENKKIS